jgi:multiple sugar transport system permease protein
MISFFGGSRRARREALWAYGFIAPPLLGFVLFALGPMVASFYLSFTNYEVLSAPEWVGSANYERLLLRDFFVGKTLYNTIYYFVGIPIGMALSLLLAMALNQKLRFERLFRTIFFLPAVCSGVALALLWKWIYHADYGLLNSYLQELGVTHPPAWLDHPATVRPALVAMGVWTNLGYNMVLFLAALQGVPKHLLEAAEIDGAGRWHRFWHVTFPSISPTTFFIAVTGIIAGFQNFDQIFVMTRGGPEYASATYMIYVFVTGFQYFKMGYASAMAWVLAAVVFLVTWLQFRLAKRWVHDG